MAALPADILLLICEELGNQHAFGTLFNVALSSKYLARSALTCMYRVHPHARIRPCDLSEDQLLEAERRVLIYKWARQWNSIILSSLGKTAYPYCLYIRLLDLTDLEDLLIDHVFRKSVAKTFFAGDMAPFWKNKPISADPIGTANLVGEQICKFAGDAADRYGGTAAVEELRGHVEEPRLPEWIGRLPRLKSITLWQGFVLNGAVGEVIKNHCPDFDALTIYECHGIEGLYDSTDPLLAAFCTQLRPNTLRDLQVISRNDIDMHTFMSLNDHYRSLKCLSLTSLKKHAVESLPFLKRCTAIQRLDLKPARGWQGSLDSDILEEIISWLTSCRQLSSITVDKFVDAPQIMTAICLEDAIHLESLQMQSHSTLENEDFCRALAHQPSLEYVRLKAAAHNSRVGNLLNSLICLKRLKYLNILDTSAFFSSSDIRCLVDNLSQLQDFSVSGYKVLDDIWASLSTLSELRNVYFHAKTYFTARGILEYISKLQPTNAGLQLSVLSSGAGVEMITSKEYKAIQRAIAEKVNGRFEIQRSWSDGSGINSNYGSDGESSWDSGSD